MLWINQTMMYLFCCYTPSTIVLLCAYCTYITSFYTICNFRFMKSFSVLTDYSAFKKFSVQFSFLFISFFFFIYLCYLSLLPVIFSLWAVTFFVSHLVTGMFSSTFSVTFSIFHLVTVATFVFSAVTFLFFLFVAELLSLGCTVTFYIFYLLPNYFRSGVR